MTEDVNKKFPEGISKIMDWFMEVKDSLKEDGRKFVRSEFKKIDKVYKDSDNNKSKAIKDFANSLKDYVNTQSKSIWATVKKIKRLRIVLKDDT